MLTDIQKLEKYEAAWALIDTAMSELTPIHKEDDISDLLGRAQLLKDKIETKCSVLREFDPS